MKLSASTAIALILAVSAQVGLAFPVSANTNSENLLGQDQITSTQDQIKGATTTNACMPLLRIKQYCY